MGDVVNNAEKFRQGWRGGLPETPCGFGSRMDQTAAQREWIPHIAWKYGLRTVADVGAGDLNWMRHVEWPDGTVYTAYDLVPRSAEVQAFDVRLSVPPAVDLIVCLWVLNHLPFDDCRAALDNIRCSGARYLMMTDRPKWHHEQPPELVELAQSAVESLLLRPESGDRIVLVSLC